MGKKMKKFPFLFKVAETTASAWPWAPCVSSPRTLSFRVDSNGSMYKTLNSAYIVDDKNALHHLAETPGSLFGMADSFERRLPSEICNALEDESETAVIRGLSSDRLFFEPGETSSILGEAKAHDFPYGGRAAIMAMDSRDPFLDFRLSMEEMVEAHGLQDWECLEELLTCYLRVNGRDNHGYIVGAFVDLLLHLALAAPDSSNDACTTSAIDEHCSYSSTTTQCSFTSPLSFSSSTYSSTSPRPENEDEIVVEKNADMSSSCFSSSSSSYASGA